MRFGVLWSLDPPGNAAKLARARGRLDPVELAAFPGLAPESTLVRRGRRTFVEPVRWTTVALFVGMVLYFLGPALVIERALRPGTSALAQVTLVAVLVLWVAGVPYASAAILVAVIRCSVQAQDVAVTYARTIFRAWGVRRTVPIAEVALRIHEVSLRRPGGGLWRGFCLVLTHEEFCMALNRHSSRERAESDVRSLPEALQSRFAGDGVAVNASVYE